MTLLHRPDSWLHSATCENWICLPRDQKRLGRRQFCYGRSCGQTCQFNSIHYSPMSKTQMSFWIICLCESIYDFPFTKSINTKKKHRFLCCSSHFKDQFQRFNQCLWEIQRLAVGVGAFSWSPFWTTQNSSWMWSPTMSTWCANMLQVLLLVCLLVLVGVFFLFGLVVGCLILLSGETC